jgi:hypothetical protein
LELWIVSGTSRRMIRKVQDGAGCSRYLGRQFPMQRVRYEQIRLYVIHDPAQVVDRIRGVEPNHNIPGFEHRQYGRNQRRVVLHQDRDTAARRTLAREKRMRQSIRSNVEFRIGRLPCVGYDRRPRPTGFGHAFKAPGDRILRVGRPTQFLQCAQNALTIVSA